jgi:quinoprotein glucose dehydrogenase
MTPEEQAHWKERFAKAQNKGLFTPTGLTDTISIPGVNGGPFFWDTGADAANGIVFVESKDFPSILKMVKAGESTSSNSGGTIPGRIQAGGGRGRGGGWRGGWSPDGAAVWAHDL